MDISAPTIMMGRKPKRVVIAPASGWRKPQAGVLHGERQR